MTSYTSIDYLFYYHLFLSGAETMASYEGAEAASAAAALLARGEGEGAEESDTELERGGAEGPTA